MKLRRLGRIFDPADYHLISNSAGFAQSPQGLVLSDRVRVFFSTRTRDDAGQFLSHCAYADFDHSFQRVLSTSSHVVLPLGDLGTFDEHGIFPLSPFYDGGVIHAYTTGWSRRSSVPVETAIGYARSVDGGRTFTRPLGCGPIVAAAPHEPFLVGDAFVRRFEGRLHMWYIFGTAWKTQAETGETERVYKIGHATSIDGLAWIREEGLPIISDVLDSDECQALPTVIYFDGCYHMFFCYREAFGFRTGIGRGYRIGHAVSTNLRDWQRDENSVLRCDGSDWDSEMQCYPQALTIGDRAFLLYNGNEFGRHGFGIADIVA